MASVLAPPPPPADDLVDGEDEGGRTEASSSNILEHGWWSVVVWVTGLALGAGALSDNSFLTHLSTGRLIRSSGAPTHDVFTFASGGKPVVVQSWLASWCYATLEAIGGATAIRMFVAATAGVLLLVLWRVSRPAGSLLARVGLVAMAGMVGLLWWNERPQLIGFLAFALVALVLVEDRSPWWLVPIFVVWVNVHGTFPLGLVYLFGSIGVAVVARRRIVRRDLLLVGAAVVGVVLAAIVSPYGFEMLTFPVEMLGRSDSLILITEWRPLAFRDLNSVVFLAEAVGILALLVWRRSWMRLLLAIVFVGLALSAVRNVAVAALVLIPLAAPALDGLGSPDPTVPAPRRRRLAFGAIGAASVAAFILMTPGYDLGAYPVRAVDVMEERGYVGRGDEPNLRILTHDYNGAYLEWRYGRRANTWIDDRAELHAFETVRDYVLLLSDIGDPEVVLDRHPHDVVVWAAPSPLARFLERSDAYEIVYRGEGTIVACRIASGEC